MKTLKNNVIFQSTELDAIKIQIIGYKRLVIPIRVTPDLYLETGATLLPPTPKIVILIRLLLTLMSI